MRIGQVSLTSSCAEKGVCISPLHELNQYGPRQEGCVIIKAVEKKFVSFLCSEAKGIYFREKMF